MTRLIKTVSTIALAGFVFAGCAPMTPRLDGSFGEAVTLARAQQVLDKDAPAKNAGKTAAGISGSVAKLITDRYEKTFCAPETQPNVFAIGVSGSNANAR